MSCPPAEPVGNLAAKLAFEIYIVGAMFFAVDNFGTHNQGRTFATHVVLWFKLIILICFIGAIAFLILGNDILLFSLLFIAIVSSRSLRKK